MAKCWSFSIDGHYEDLLYYLFLIFHACLKFSVAKNENRAEICNKYLLSGVSSFWNNAVYSLHNQTSSDLQSS